jgi:uncharacterized membrane protein
MLYATGIQANSAFDFKINLPKGMITPQASFKNLISMNEWLVPLPLLLFNLFIVYGFIKYYKLKREKNKSIIAYECIKPESLPPAIAGLLVNFSASVRGITATIIDLAVKGYIYIQDSQAVLA